MEKDDFITNVFKVVKKNPILTDKIGRYIIQSVNKGIREDKEFAKLFVGHFGNILKDQDDFWEIVKKDFKDNGIKYDEPQIKPIEDKLLRDRIKELEKKIEKLQRK